MKIRWISALAPVALFAGSLHFSAQAPKVDGIAHVAYRVSDLTKAVGFFQKLGFEEAIVMKNGEITTQIFVKINDREFIELYPRSDSSQPLGWMHVCYESDAVNSLNALYAAHGLKPSPANKGAAGNLVFSLKDPEGRVTEFAQYLPASRHDVDRGKHLGAHRISDQLQGVEFAATDLATDQQFYTDGLGFEAQSGKAGLRIRISSDPDLWVELHKGNATDQPQLLFRVTDAADAAHQLQGRGLTVKRQNNLASVNDPDGNSFAFVQTHSH
jgi:catechol 2,3-dioxygenase-like lactoylglutathione lyase family enzyme